MLIMFSSEIFDSKKGKVSWKFEQKLCIVCKLMKEKEHSNVRFEFKLDHSNENGG